MCGERLALGGVAGGIAGAVVVQPGLPHRTDAWIAGQSLDGGQFARPAPTPSRAASLGWMATPATTFGHRSAAATAHREPSTSQPICTMRVTPTSAAQFDGLGRRQAGHRLGHVQVAVRVDHRRGQRLRQLRQVTVSTLAASRNLAMTGTRWQVEHGPETPRRDVGGLFRASS